jgi:hypothetical protein
MTMGMRRNTSFDVCCFDMGLQQTERNGKEKMVIDRSPTRVSEESEEQLPDSDEWMFAQPKY